MVFFYAKRAAVMLRTSGPWFALRAVKYTILKRLGALQLLSIFICPSHECNANCVHCYERFAQNAGSTLTTNEVKDVIDQFRKLGGMIVHFCSGEFLLRRDRFELIRYVADNHMYCTINTNGLLLDEPLIDELKTAGVKELVVSIDSADPARHDELRGVEGCFEKATNGLRIAKAKGLSTAIWTYISRSNFDQLDGVSKLGRELGVKHTLAFFPMLSGQYFNKFDENLTAEERDAFRKEFNPRPDVRIALSEETDQCAGGGKEHLSVMPTGDVTFCPPVPYSYGNIRTKSLRDCLRDCLADHKRFCTSRCTGQCIVNFQEYRDQCNATFLYKQADDSHDPD